MTLTTVAEAEAPLVLCVDAGEFRAKTGTMWREVAQGSVVRVTDARSGLVLGYVVRDCPAELEPYAHLLPGPHEAHDSLGPEAALCPPAPRTSPGTAGAVRCMGRP